MRVCLNCHTENPLDEVFCSECGMSLTRAPTGEEVVKARKAFEAESPSRSRNGPRPEQPPSLVYGSVRALAAFLLLLYLGAIPTLLERVDVEALVFSSPSGACLATVLFFLPIPALVALFGWPAAQGLGAWLGDMWYREAASREAYREARRLGADMIRSHLAGIELSKADLEGANAAGADLQGAILPEASLVEANLSSANLSRASLRRSDLSNANLFRANLQGAHLESANLLGAHLEGANVEGAHLAGARLDDTTVMPQGWEEIVASKPEDEPLSESADEGDTIA